MDIMDRINESLEMNNSKNNLQQLDEEEIRLPTITSADMAAITTKRNYVNPAVNSYDAVNCYA